MIGICERGHDDDCRVVPMSELKPVALMHEHDDEPTEFELYNYGAGSLTTYDKEAGWTETPLYGPEALEAAFRLALEAAAGVCRRYVTPHGRAGSAPDACEGAVQKVGKAILAIDPAQHLGRE